MAKKELTWIVRMASYDTNDGRTWIQKASLVHGCVPVLGYTMERWTVVAIASVRREPIDELAGQGCVGHQVMTTATTTSNACLTSAIYP